MRGLKCPELRKLPSPPRYTSVQWRNQTPGSLEPFFLSTTPRRAQAVDPSHPAAGVPKLKFPFIRRDDIGIKLLPMGLLLREPRPFPATSILTWDERVQMAKEAGLTGDRSSKTPNVPTNSDFGRQGQLYPERDYNSASIPARRTTPHGPLLDLAFHRAAHRVPMSFHISTSKKRMGHFRYMRRGIETRLRAAISLIVTRGAFSQNDTICFNKNDAGRKWVLQGWAYMFFPTTEVYRMPYPKLVEILRNLLLNVNRKATSMENDWLNQALLSDEVVRSKQIIKPSEATFHISQNLVGQRRTSEPSSTSEARLPNGRRCLMDGTSPVQQELSKRPKPAKSSSNVLAGKDHEVWKKELLAGLELIRKRIPLN